MLKNKVEVNKLTISVRTHIKLKDIASFLNSAGYGSDYWCDNNLEFESGKALTKEGIIVEDQEDATKHILNLKKIKKGLTTMAKKETRHFADFIRGDYDQTTADVFLQCCLFGKVIYG